MTVDICVATSAGVFDVETVTYVDLRKGKLGCVLRNFMSFVSLSVSDIKYIFAESSK